MPCNLFGHVWAYILAKNTQILSILEVSVPQGSCGGPVLYSCYASRMQKELPPNTTVDVYGYADDCNLGNKLKPSESNAEGEAISIPERSLYNIKNWMDKDCLKMNDGKN